MVLPRPGEPGRSHPQHTKRIQYGTSASVWRPLGNGRTSRALFADEDSGSRPSHEQNPGQQECADRRQDGEAQMEHAVCAIGSGRVRLTGVHVRHAGAFGCDGSRRGVRASGGRRHVMHGGHAQREQAQQDDLLCSAGALRHVSTVPSPCPWPRGVLRGTHVTDLILLKLVLRRPGALTRALCGGGAAGGGGGAPPPPPPPPPPPHGRGQAVGLVAPAYWLCSGEILTTSPLVGACTILPSPMYMPMWDTGE